MLFGGKIERIGLSPSLFHVEDVEGITRIDRQSDLPDQEASLTLLSLDPGLNDVNASIVSSNDSPVTVRVMKTNEELMIARHTYNLICKKSRKVEKQEGDS